MMEVSFGTMRTVVLTKNLAFKLPGCWKYLYWGMGPERSKPKWLWRSVLRGLLANMQEREFSSTGWEQLCPVLFSLPGGLLVVMPRCRRIDYVEWCKVLDYRTFVTRGCAVAESKFDVMLPNFHPDDGPAVALYELVAGGAKPNCGLVPVENKSDSFGWHGERLVAVDYG